MANENEADGTKAPFDSQAKWGTIDQVANGAQIDDATQRCLYMAPVFKWSELLTD